MALDDAFLKHHGGLEKNSLDRVLQQHNNDELTDLHAFTCSSYYDYNLFNKFTQAHKQQFSVMSTNIQSINAKIDELKAFVTEMEQMNFQFDAICLQETWLDDTQDTSLIQLDNYTCITQSKSSSSKGGLLIYLNNNYRYKTITTPNHSTDWENQIIKITGGILHNKSLMLGNIYRPPNDLNYKYEQFTNEFSELQSSLENINSDIVLAGDFNLDLLKINARTSFSNFLDTVISHSFYPQITLPTRLSERNGTLIDNFYCKLSPSCNPTSGILIKKFSDHQPYVTFLHSTRKNTPTPRYIQSTTHTEEAYTNLASELNKTDTWGNLNKNPTADPNLNYNVFIEILQSAKEKHLPSKLIRFKKYKHKKSTWITMGILKSIKFRDKLYMTLKMSEPDTQDYAHKLTNLRTYNRILKCCIRTAKKLHYEHLFHKYKQDIKQTWCTINSILNKSRKTQDLPDSFHGNNDTNITEKSEIANSFNTFFTQVGPKLANNIDIPLGKSHSDYLTKPSNSTFNFQNIEETDIIQIIDNLPNKTSRGNDDLSYQFIKRIKISLTKPLSIIINQILNSGIFPEKLKIAKVIPIHKKDDNKLFNNYRPISLLPVMSKIVEKCIYKQLYDYFQKNNMFYAHQYGFRTGHCTEYAALEIIDRVTTQLDINNIPLNIFLDLSKAFDSLDHAILLYKLKYYGVTGTPLQLIKSYLTDRNQFVQIDNTQSSILHLKTGVPQGSILGPLLFLIYINDFPCASTYFSFIMYADDTTLSSTLPNIKNSRDQIIAEQLINTELNKIDVWLRCNKLSLNISKTKYMLYSMPQKQTQHLSIKLGTTSIDQVYHFNFLGIVINSNLKWENHVNNISYKCTRVIGILNKLKKVLPTRIKLLLYNTLILPHLTYGINSWGFNCSRIKKLQKKAVRVIYNSKYNAHTSNIFKQLNLLKIGDILTIEQMKFYHKYTHNKLPQYLQDIPIRINMNLHTHNTRQANEIHILRIHHEFARRLIRNSIPYTINNLPEQVTSKIRTHSQTGFITYAKHYFIQSYQETCTRLNCFVCSE